MRHAPARPSRGRRPSSVILALLLFIITGGCGETLFAQVGLGAIRRAADPPVIEGLDVPDQVFDLRFSPRTWQASICLPDDPHKTIVNSKGELCYAFNQGKRYDFGCRVNAYLEGAEDAAVSAQRLLDPRVPIVETRFGEGPVRLTAFAWAAAPDEGEVDQWAPRRHDYLLLEIANLGDAPAAVRPVIRVDPLRFLDLVDDGAGLAEGGGKGPGFARFWPAAESAEVPAATRIEPVTPAAPILGWATPEGGLDARFRDILVGWAAPMSFRFRVEAGKTYRAAFAVFEGYHREAGVRPLKLSVEGAESLNLDPVRDFGFNRMGVIFLDGGDRDGDGYMDLSVASGHPGLFDENTILSALWIFPGDGAPDAETLLAGKGDGKALARVDAKHIPAPGPVLIRFPEQRLRAGKTARILAAFPQGVEGRPRATCADDGPVELARARTWWENVDLPYDRIRVPDRKLQGLLDSCIRNIWQARELRNGRPAFQVGPTHYRGLWAADGPFLLEAVSYLGRMDEARPGLELLAEGDEGPQGVGFSKKSGLRLWMIRRHFELTGDTGWLKGMWPKVEREVARIREYREMTRKDPKQANFGLMPIGFGDGGLGGQHREYTNVYWNLAGLKAAVAMAQDLKREEQARDWDLEYQDFRRAYDRAARRDLLDDGKGNRYVPVTMTGEAEQLPQRGAWAFLHSVYPGRVFDRSDPFMTGTLSMLAAVEEEGLVFGTGWIIDGIWNYAASFYAHALLWTGHGRKAASTLYAFANHACPLLCWREEQNLVTQEKERYCGDMPHNWASAEFIRLVRHLMILERGDRLHLLEGLPRAFCAPGMVTMLKEVPTSFGEMSLRLEVFEDHALLHVDPPARGAAGKGMIVLHLEQFGRKTGSVKLNGTPIEHTGGPVITKGSVIEIEFLR